MRSNEGGAPPRRVATLSRSRLALVVPLSLPRGCGTTGRDRCSSATSTGDGFSSRVRRG